MESQLDLVRQYLRTFPVNWSKDGLDELVHSFEQRTLDKGQFLLKDGQTCRHISFVVQGCLRFYLLDEGEERSIFFFPEGNFCSDSRSFLTQKPARCFIEALEDCQLLIISKDRIAELVKKHTDVADCYRLVVEKLLISSEGRIIVHVLSNPETRYKRLMEDFGNLVNRVPQKYLASYLGITPVSLSRIRARVAST